MANLEAELPTIYPPARRRLSSPICKKTVKRRPQKTTDNMERLAREFPNHNWLEQKISQLASQPNIDTVKKRSREPEHSWKNENSEFCSNFQIDNRDATNNNVKSTEPIKRCKKRKSSSDPVHQWAVHQELKKQSKIPKIVLRRADIPIDSKLPKIAPKPSGYPSVGALEIKHLQQTEKNDLNKDNFIEMKPADRNIINNEEEGEDKEDGVCKLKIVSVRSINKTVFVDSTDENFVICTITENKGYDASDSNSRTESEKDDSENDTVSNESDDSSSAKDTSDYCAITARAAECKQHNNGNDIDHTVENEMHDESNEVECNNTDAAANEQKVGLQVNQAANYEIYDFEKQDTVKSSLDALGGDNRTYRKVININTDDYQPNSSKLVQNQNEVLRADKDVRDGNKLPTAKRHSLQSERQTPYSSKLSTNMSDASRNNTSGGKNGNKAVTLDTADMAHLQKTCSARKKENSSAIDFINSDENLKLGEPTATNQHDSPGNYIKPQKNGNLTGNSATPIEYSISKENPIVQNVSQGPIQLCKDSLAKQPSQNAFRECLQYFQDNTKDSFDDDPSPLQIDEGYSDMEDGEATVQSPEQNNLVASVLMSALDFSKTTQKDADDKKSSQFSKTKQASKQISLPGINATTSSTGRTVSPKRPYSVGAIHTNLKNRSSPVNKRPFSASAIISCELNESCTSQDDLKLDNDSMAQDLSVYSFKITPPGSELPDQLFEENDSEENDSTDSKKEDNLALLALQIINRPNRQQTPQIENLTTISQVENQTSQVSDEAQKCKTNNSETINIDHKVLSPCRDNSSNVSEFITGTGIEGTVIDLTKKGLDKNDTDDVQSLNYVSLSKSLPPPPALRHADINISEDTSNKSCIKETKLKLADLPMNSTRESSELISHENSDCNTNKAMSNTDVNSSPENLKYSLSPKGFEVKCDDFQETEGPRGSIKTGIVRNSNTNIKPCPIPNKAVRKESKNKSVNGNKVFSVPPQSLPPYVDNRFETYWKGHGFPSPANGLMRGGPKYTHVAPPEKEFRVSNYNKPVLLNENPHISYGMQNHISSNNLLSYQREFQKQYTECMTMYGEVFGLPIEKGPPIMLTPESVPFGPKETIYMETDEIPIHREQNPTITTTRQEYDSVNASTHFFKYNEVTAKNTQTFHPKANEGTVPSSTNMCFKPERSPREQYFSDVKSHPSFGNRSNSLIQGAGQYMTSPYQQSPPTSALTNKKSQQVTPPAAHSNAVKYETNIPDSFQQSMEHVNRPLSLKRTPQEPTKSGQQAPILNHSGIGSTKGPPLTNHPSSKPVSYGFKHRNLSHEDQRAFNISVSESLHRQEGRSQQQNRPPPPPYQMQDKNVMTTQKYLNRQYYANNKSDCCDNDVIFVSTESGPVTRENREQKSITAQNHTYPNAKNSELVKTFDGNLARTGSNQPPYGRIFSHPPQLIHAPPGNNLNQNVGPRFQLPVVNPGVQQGMPHPQFNLSPGRPAPQCIYTHGTSRSCSNCNSYFMQLSNRKILQESVPGMPTNMYHTSIPQQNTLSSQESTQKALMAQQRQRVRDQPFMYQVPGASYPITRPTQPNQVSTSLPQYSYDVNPNRVPSLGYHQPMQTYPGMSPRTTTIAVRPPAILLGSGPTMNTAIQQNSIRTIPTQGNGNRCVICPGPSNFLCSRCKRAWYCTKMCQTKDWQSGHNMVCD